MRTIVLFTISNIFMTFAWYGHLKYRNEALWKVILASWGIAFFEYCFQVPANRIGSYQFNAAQLKTIQEIITLSIFPVFSVSISATSSNGTTAWASHLSWPRRFSFFTSGRLRGENRCSTVSICECTLPARRRIEFSDYETDEIRKRRETCSARHRQSGRVV